MPKSSNRNTDIPNLIDKQLFTLLLEAHGYREISNDLWQEPVISNNIMFSKKKINLALSKLGYKPMPNLMWVKYN